MLEALRAEAEALREALEAAGVEAPEPPAAAGSVYRQVAAMRGYVEELQRLLEEAGVLRGRELEAYRLVALERRRRGELLLREAAELVAEKLGIGYVEARKLLLSLIERGVLEPRL